MHVEAFFEADAVCASHKGLLVAVRELTPEGEGIFKKLDKLVIVHCAPPFVYEIILAQSIAVVNKVTELTVWKRYMIC
jgi:hypothetical protein